MFIPFILHITVYAKGKLLQVCKGKVFDARKEFVKCLWHLPFLHVVKNLVRTWRLWNMSYGMEGFLAKDQVKVEFIQHKAGTAGMWESYTEVNGTLLN